MGLDLMFRSVKPFPGEPAVFSAGGYAAIAEDGREYCFDFEYSSWDYSHDEQGHLIVDVNCKYIDEYFIDDLIKYNDQTVTSEELTPEFITKSILNEVFYECYEHENFKEVDLIPLECIRFNIYDETGNHEVPKEELERYYRENAIHLDRRAS